jgi:hypothetical protein
MIRIIPVAGVAGLAFGLAPSGAGAATIASVSQASPHGASAASASSNPCSGQSQNHIVRNFVRGPSVYPLRCGTKTWGYTHLVAGHEYDPAMIALTVARGSGPFLGLFTYVPNPEGACPTEEYRVVENAGALNGTGVRPQGIITAYWTAITDASPLACK